MILWDVTALLEAALGKSRLDSVYLRFQFDSLKIAVTSTLHQVLAPGSGRQRPVRLMGSWSVALPRHAGTRVAFRTCKCTHFFTCHACLRVHGRTLTAWILNHMGRRSRSVDYRHCRIGSEHHDPEVDLLAFGREAETLTEQSPTASLDHVNTPRHYPS